MYPYYYDRINNWPYLLEILQKSRFAEELVCAIASEWQFHENTIPVKKIDNIKHQLALASFYRTTAVGTVQRLVNGEYSQTMIQTVTFCIANAENHDQNVSQEWQQLLTDQTKQNQRLLQKLIEWQNQAELYLQQAKETIKKMGFPFPDQHKNN